jgi:alanyl-tRNA synthetase
MSSKIADINTPLADSLRAAFFQFYLSRGHKEVPNVSLVPNVDSTLLFTNSGMFPLVNYLAGEKHPLGTRLVNFQRSLRTGEKDLAEIGDWKHTTMFEMMGNWSLGDYFKAEQIPQVMELYVEKFGLDPKRMYVSVFAGDSDAPRDNEAISLWQEAFKRYGVEAEVAPVFFETDSDGKEIAYEIADDGSKMYRTDWTMEDFPNQRIFMYGKKENWWQRGDTAGELGGPDSEMFYTTGTPHDSEKWGVGHPNSDSPAYLEIGNSVFMQYRLDDNLKWQELPQKNVDFGGGFVRVLLSKQGVSDVYETEVFVPVIKKIEEISGKQYKQNGEEYDLTKYFRIIADHIFGSTFVIADGVMPGNKEQGYILRRFIRRAIRMGKRLGIESDFLAQLAEVIVGIYQRHYEHLAPAFDQIVTALQTEEAKFRRTLANGVKELQKLADSQAQAGGKLTGKELFHVYETYGFPLELSFEDLGVEAADQAR